MSGTEAWETANSKKRKKHTTTKKKRKLSLSLQLPNVKVPNETNVRFNCKFKKQ